MTPLNIHLALSCAMALLLLIGCHVAERNRSEKGHLWPYRLHAITLLVTAYLIKFG